MQSLLIELQSCANKPRSLKNEVHYSGTPVQLSAKGLDSLLCYIMGAHYK